MHGSGNSQPCAEPAALLRVGMGLPASGAAQLCHPTGLHFVGLGFFAGSAA